MPEPEDMRAWECWIAGRYTCTCGRRNDFVSHDLQRSVTCGGCGTVYRVRFRATFSRAPDDEQTGHPDFMGRLTAGLKEIDERQKKGQGNNDA